jgi:hypothetical protein
MPMIPAVSTLSSSPRSYRLLFCCDSRTGFSGSVWQLKEASHANEWPEATRHRCIQMQ